MIKSNTQETFIQRWVLLILVWLGIFFLEYLGVTQAFRTLAERVVVPVESVVTQVVVRFTQPITFIGTSYEEGAAINELQLQLSKTQAQLAELQGVQAENEALRELFKNTDRTWKDTILATPIIAYGNPAVAAGLSSGVHLGDAVLSYGTIVGRVGTTTDQQAEVLLLSSVSTPYLLAQTESGATGIVKGTGQQIIFTEVNRSSQINSGELVVTLGQAGIPKNLPIGTIRTQTSTAAEPVLTFQLNQPVSFYEASVVEIIPSQN